MSIQWLHKSRWEAFFFFVTVICIFWYNIYILWLGFFFLFEYFDDFLDSGRFCENRTDAFFGLKIQSIRFLSSIRLLNLIIILVNIYKTIKNLELFFLKGFLLLFVRLFENLRHLNHGNISQRPYWQRIQNAPFSRSMKKIYFILKVQL